MGMGGLAMYGAITSSAAAICKFDRWGMHVHWGLLTHIGVSELGHNWALVRYVKLRVVHTPGMPGTFYPPPRISDPDLYHGTCVTHVPWCMLRSLTSGFLWSLWWGKRSRHSWCMHNPQFYVSCKRPNDSRNGLAPHWIRQKYSSY